MKKSKFDSLYFPISYFAASALLLTIIQPPFHFSFLAWITYVPLIIAALSSENRVGPYLCSALVAFVYWLGNVYWMGYVTIAGWIAFCAWTGLLWPALMVTLRFLHRKKVPLFIASAVLIVGIERLQGLFLGGFYWRHLSHSQYENIMLIQIADIFGAAGVSFLIAMVNGFLAELFIIIQNKNLSKKKIFLEFIIIITTLAATMRYGLWQEAQAEDAIKQGLIVGAVQSNLPQNVKDSNSFDVNQQVFEELLNLSRQAASAGAVLIAWPETIIPAIMDKSAWPFLLEDEEPVYFHKKLGEHASDGVYVLVGAPGAYIEYLDNDELRYDKFNTAFLYEPDGDQAAENYDKIHLVPFGEVVPFKQSVPLLYNLLMNFSPYDYDYNLTPGDDYTVFAIQDEKAKKNYRFGVMICYEGTVPAIARGFALDDQGRKKVDWLVNISNDGWFVKFRDNKVRPSTELAQHTLSCVFRAVENRIAIVRSVNTGISCVIDPIGNIKDGYITGDLPEKAFERKGVQGYFADTVSIDSRVTVFSRYGQWLDNGCAIAVFSVLILLITGAIIRNINKRTSSNEKN
ncbi:MAG: apolipoprotein N-acyltransferase [Sedimentisphaerales bacterium]|nr:apolipoprotein N-acyltransferase [Sedimentisphaerales bacterium]